MQQTCKATGLRFEITEDDLKFYDKISPVINGKKFPIPPPSFSPPERERRRMAWCNEQYLYPGTCQFCQKAIITEFSPGAPCPVYCIHCWWGDRWDPLQYGREIDFSRSILDQVHELELMVPHSCVNTDLGNENSEYTHYAGHEKNCYMMFHTSFTKDCYYGYGVKKAVNCIDNHYCHESELCYECIDVKNCYGLAWCQDCQNCHNSRFIRDCIGCSNCLLCVGLRNKKYCISNEQLSAQEYKERLAALDFGSYQTILKLQAEYQKIQAQHTWKCLQMEMTENCLGNYLYRARESRFCFDCSDIEFSKYCSQLQLGVKSCFDIYQYGINIELCHECAMIGYNSYNCHFCYDILEQCADLFYCMSCHSSKNCFGCFGLKNKRYCILNKQYSREEYENLVPRIIEHMRRTHLRPAERDSGGQEWGEFFPIKYSPSAYNKTMAQYWYPVSKEDALQQGWEWEDRLPYTTGRETCTDLPDNIRDVPDSIVDEILICRETGRNYKIIPQELDFYRENQIPLPLVCFDVRRERRMRLRNPRKFWQRECQKCGKKISSVYAPERQETVYCEQCYLTAIH